MGKRKSRKIQTKAAAPKCDTVFDCPYCSHRQTIEVQILKKDGLGKLFCRICGYRYQKRLGPLDKQVDIYCAMIDDAEAINSKKPNDGIGLIGRDDDDEGDDLFDDPAGSKKVAQNTTDDDAAAEARDDYEEEKKEAAEVNPELMDMLRRQRSSDPFSASQKIAEMGLSREPSHAAASAAQAAQQLTAKMMDQNQQRDFGRIVSEGLTPVRVSAGADAEEDSDSDDLF